MTKTNASKPSSQAKPKVAEPTLAELLAQEQAAEAEKAAQIAALEQQLADEKAAAADKAAQFKAIVDEKLAPHRAERDDSFVVELEALERMEATAAPIREKYAEKRAKLDEAETKELTAALEADAAIVAEQRQRRADIEAYVEDTLEVPVAVFNEDVTPVAAAPAKGGTGAKSTKGPKVANLGVFEPVQVTAPHRRSGLDPTKPCTVVYEGRQTEQGIELFSKRVDDEYTSINQAKVDGPYAQHDTSYTKPCTAPGWHSVADVRYALAVHLGIIGDYPECEPESDPSNIAINGKPLAAKTSPEVTIKETV